VSKYRILEKPTCDYSGQPTVEYFAQYKLWGLFWVSIENHCGYVSSWYESNAHRAINAHKAKKAAKKRKVRIIDVED
jgi:hypothetical protein